MANIIIGKRLEKISSLIEGKCLLDIGSDHAKLPIFALQSGIVDYAYATDLNLQPLEKGKLAACDAGVNNVEFILASGLLLSENVISKSTDIVIAGMGGELIADILENSNKNLIKDKILLLQPMTKSSELKEYLFKNGFEIKNEFIVFENNKYFHIIKAVFNNALNQFSEFDILIGKLDTNDNAVKDYFNYKIKKIEKTVKEIKKSETTSTKQLESQLEIYKKAVLKNAY